LDAPRRWLAELDVRAGSRRARAESWLDLYAWSRSRGPEQPFCLLMHFVSRDGLEPRAAGGPFTANALRLVAELDERADARVFTDAWPRVCATMPAAADPTRPAGELERDELLLHLARAQDVVEELIRDPRFRPALAVIAFLEQTGRERPLRLPCTTAEIRVDGFADRDRRIDALRRAFDWVLAAPDRRDACFEWALAHPV
jgi:hypothetical protein